MKKFLKIFLLIVFFGLIVGTFYYLFKKSQKEPVVYETAQAFKTNIIKKTVATGSVIPRKDIALKPQVSGIITEIYVEAGDKVSQGDKIAKIKIVPDMLSLNNAETRVNKAKISLKEAKQNYERAKKLYDDGVISASEFEPSEFAFKSAQEELESAENNLDLVKEGATKKNKETTNTIVRSTNTGMVLEVPVEEGYSVIETNNFNEGTTIATVADMSDMIFEGKVDESEVGKLHVGMPLILKIGAIENKYFNATLEYISPKGVEENGAIQFEIKANVFLKDSLFVRAGYSANADIVLDRVDSVMAINESLIQFDRKGNAFVEIEKSSQVFDTTFIQTGLSDGINIEVVSGIKKDDKIKVWNIIQPNGPGRR